MTGDSAIARNAKPSLDFSAKLERTAELLRQAAQDHPAAVTQASSLGAEDMVISHLVGELSLEIDIFVLDTGLLHAETLAVLDRLNASAGRPVRVFTPNDEAAIQFVAREGRDAMYRSLELRKTCCAIRKTEPLARALEGYTAWITGMRREQSGERAAVPSKDSSQTRIKYNPLAEWTWGDVWHHIERNGVAYNPLHDRFYPSIGCAPCTRAISLGEDFRAGRWWWENDDRKECGLHVQPLQTNNQGVPA